MYMYITYILYYIDSVFVYIFTFPKKLYIFICLCVPVLHPLVSTWRAPFSISYKARLKVKVAQSCLTLGNPMDCRVHGIPQARKRVGSHSLLHVFSPTQGSNPGLPHCRQILYQLHHQGSPRILEWAACPFSRGSSQPRNRTRVSCIAGGFFTSWATREACKASLVVMNSLNVYLGKSLFLLKV